MEYFRQKYCAGAIDFKTYEKMLEVIAHLEQNEYEFVSSIGDGSYGSVIKVKSLKTGDEMAAKIVKKNYATEGELHFWKKLQHANILKLSHIQFVYHSDSYIFFTPVYPKTLEQTIFEPGFTSNKSAIKLATSYLNQILDAVAYIHDEGLSHCDLKCNNILISDTETAVLADFGFLSSAENLIEKYGTPMVYRCPEARATDSGLTQIDGRKLDVWTLGMLAFELFTKMSLLREISKRNSELSCWFTDVYPLLQNSLQKSNFIKLMQEAFPSSKINNKIAANTINFISSCLHLVPEKRPNIHQLQNHKLLRGSWRAIEAQKQDSIWEKRVSVQEFNFILRKNHLEEVPACAAVPDFHESQYNETYSLHSIDNKTFNIDTYLVSSKQNLNGEVSTTYQVEACSGDSIERKQLLHLDNTFTQNSHCSPKISEIFYSDGTPHPFESNQSLSGEITCHSPSSNLSNANESSTLEYDFNFGLFESSEVVFSSSASIVSEYYTDNENSYKDETVATTEDRAFRNESDDIPELTREKSRSQRFGKWWKRKTSAVTRVFITCFPCSKRL